MTKPKSARVKRVHSRTSPVEEARAIHDQVRLRLVAATAGRCEFRGCNRDLYQHPVTTTPGNYSQMAHIVAFREEGPRGKGPRPRNVNIFENLMLLCADCHHLIDTQPAAYPVRALRDHKREHEDRISAVTALGPEYRTTVIQVRGTIGGQPVDIPAADIREALHPRYPARLPGALIDLTSFQRESESFFQLAQEQIRRELQPALRAELERKRVQHYSVFALAPIPVLACFGREIGNKVTVDIFPRHKDRAPDRPAWGWLSTGTIAGYELRKLRDGTEPMSVALLLSLSGRIDLSSLPSDMDIRFTLYEILFVG